MTPTEATVRRLAPKRNLHAVPGAGSEPALTEPEILNTLRGMPHVSATEIGERAGRNVLEAARRRAAEDARRRRNRRLAVWALIVGVCVVLAWPLGLVLRALVR